MGMQDFNYETKYDVVWIQWVLCYLTDDDLTEFLLKTQFEGLTEGLNKKGKKTTGLIFIKENVRNGKFYHEQMDNSIIRTNE